MGDHVFLKVMPKRGVVRFDKRGKLSQRYFGALQGTRGGGYNQVFIGITARLIGCSCGIPCLHALKVNSRSESCSGLGQTCC